MIGGKGQGLAKKSVTVTKQPLRIINTTTDARKGEGYGQGIKRYGG